MLTSEEADNLCGAINEDPDLTNSAKGIFFREIKQYIEKPRAEETIIDKLSENIENYFKLNENKINKIYSLDGTQWATAAVLETKLNEVIKAINKLIDLVEHIVPQKNIIDAISKIAGVLAFVADEAGLHCDGMLQEALNLLKEK